MVEELKAKHRLHNLLKASGLTKSVYYYHRKVSKKPCANFEFMQQICDIYHHHKGRRITFTLRASSMLINHKRVQRLMVELDPKSKIRPKRYKFYKGSVGKIADNLLNREFSVNKPKQKWVTEVTEFKVNNQNVYTYSTKNS